MNCFFFQKTKNYNFPDLRHFQSCNHDYKQYVDGKTKTILAEMMICIQQYIRYFIEHLD